ncbi:hypothetical protein SAMN05421788_112121 [Filimonas lacunae]|uniref:Uncharacterized protein n=1 Tax=Filimonas lacunae TaxID=477680 RepID=A0A1N7REC2_9BACT|nr:hypothetical protein SAMN05421788_112121 [Filimonas lacunae]
MTTQYAILLLTSIATCGFVQQRTEEPISDISPLINN